MNINLTLIGQSIAFAIFVWFCVKYVWPPITAAMEARQKKIADGLSAADRASLDLELAQEKATKELQKAKEEIEKGSSTGDEAMKSLGELLKRTYEARQ